MDIKFSRRKETIKAYTFKVSGFVISSNYLCVCARGSVCVCACVHIVSLQEPSQWQTGNNRRTIPSDVEGKEQLLWWKWKYKHCALDFGEVADCLLWREKDELQKSLYN